MDERTLVWSYGGGTQSAAIAVLVVEGVLPKPEFACIADTSREMPTTWSYLKDVIQPYLDKVGVKIHVIPHSYSTVDLYAKNGDLLIPAYTKTGRLPTYCSGEWKREPVKRWLREQKVKQCDMWIGFSTDEAKRCGGKSKKWVKHIYPLIEKNISRAMCYRLVEGAGLPKPPKSRCFDCPHQNSEEWREVMEYPVLFDAAEARDVLIRVNDERDGLFLHSSRMPLRMALNNNSEDAILPVRQCQDVGCFT